MSPELRRRGEREHAGQEGQSTRARKEAARKKPLLRRLWRAAHIRELIVAMDKHPGSVSLDHEFLRRQLVHCINGLRALSEQLSLLSPNAIRQRVERSMAHQRAILERLNRCASTISGDSLLEEQVKALRDAQCELLQKLIGCFQGRSSKGRGSACRRPPSLCLN